MSAAFVNMNGGRGVYTSGFEARHAVVYAHLAFPPAICHLSHVLANIMKN